jgi:hypothetical protein
MLNKFITHVKRFLKTLALLTVSLFLVASGVDAALDHLSHSVTQSSFTEYNECDRVILAYNGDLSAYKACTKPGPAAAPILLHRS